MRYVSAEQSIAAAGAVFAYVEDESLSLHKRGQRHNRSGWLHHLNWFCWNWLVAWWHPTQR